MGVFRPLVLPNGSTIYNRIAKAAMEENMADKSMAPSEQLMNLYRAWAEGGAGLLITGNVMIDSHAMTGPGGVVLEDDSQLEKFKRWADVGRSAGAQIWMQINHPGRQMTANLGQETWAPSEVAVDLGKLSKQFNPPREMTPKVIEEVVQRFVRTAELAESAGFSGVEVHAAHGYLLSQFLSPYTNKRSDQWGGSIENRARMLIDIVKRIRSKVGPGFAVAVKLNSADFQRGGFSSDDAAQVIMMLNELNVDLVELSGGSYEAPAMHGRARDGRTLAREAYFLEFADELRKVANMPIMVTGGIRRYAIAKKVVESGVEMVGMGTALAIDPCLPREWMAGKNNSPELPPITWNNKPLASLAYMAVVKHQLLQHSKNRKANPNIPPLWALIRNQVEGAVRARSYRQLMSHRNL